MRGNGSAIIVFACTFLLIFTPGALAYSILTVIEARQMAESGEALLVDVRQAQYYEEGHIPGAILFPLDSIEAKVRSGQVPFNMSDAIILYCDCPAEESSITASSILEHYGYTRVFVLMGGWQAWRDAGFPIAKGFEPGVLNPSPTITHPPKESSEPKTVAPTFPPPAKAREYVTPFIIAMLLLLSACTIILVLFYAFFIRGR